MSAETSVVHLALPKGRMQDGVFRLLDDAGIRVRVDARGYRPTMSSLDGFEIKILKPQNIVEMLHIGSRDLGFAGADWVAELKADLVELVDLELDPVRIVAAAPDDLLVDGALPKRHIVIASEYQRLTAEWIAAQGIDATLVRSYGATEVFPPEDADCIVDNTSTGSTLRANGLEIFADVMRSSTRLYAHPRSLEDAAKRDRIEHFATLLRSVLDARKRVLIEVNVGAADLERLIEVLPCMRKPTVAQLHGGDGYAVKAAVPRKQLPTLLRDLSARGGTDIIVSNLSQIVP